ncbi:MAG: hypothetical protein EZS28_053077, partial [Streblomastix strix]
MLMSRRGTNPYMAPCLFLGNDDELMRADSKVDVWSLGIVIYRMTSHSFPFDPNNDLDIKKFMEQYSQTRVLIRPPTITDNLLWDLLKKMLSFDRTLRISASEALLHPFLTNVQSLKEITPEQMQLAQTAEKVQLNGDASISKFDLNPLFAFPLVEVQKIKGQFDLADKLKRINEKI